MTPASNIVVLFQLYAKWPSDAEFSPSLYRIDIETGRVVSPRLYTEGNVGA